MSHGGFAESASSPQSSNLTHHEGEIVAAHSSKSGGRPPRSKTLARLAKRPGARPSSGASYDTRALHLRWVVTGRQARTKSGELCPLLGVEEKVAGRVMSGSSAKPTGLIQNAYDALQTGVMLVARPGKMPARA